MSYEKQKRALAGLSSGFTSLMKVWLYYLLDPAASQASRANLDRPGRSIDESLD
jgi:hypothetical protein